MGKSFGSLFGASDYPKTGMVGLNPATSFSVRCGGAPGWIGMVFAASLLAACSSSDKSIDETTGPGVTEPPPTVPTGPMKAVDIMRVLSGNSFRYSRPVNRTGTTTFNSDGTFSYQENGKGEGTGIWQASDGSLCEAFNPTSFLPRGTRTECQPFKQTAGGSYAAGNATFEAM